MLLSLKVQKREADEVHLIFFSVTLGVHLLIRCDG